MSSSSIPELNRIINNLQEQIRELEDYYLNEKDKKIDFYKKKISELNSTIESKDKEIEDLKTILDFKNKVINQLKTTKST